jgi:hypothetical protein
MAEGNVLMKTRVLPLLIGAGMVLFATAALSHHSFAGTYILDQSKTIEGPSSIS